MATTMHHGIDYIVYTLLPHAVHMILLRLVEGVINVLEICVAFISMAFLNSEIVNYIVMPLRVTLSKWTEM